MARGNLFLGTARGKLGSVVFFRKNSKQISRLRVTKVSNPRSDAQYISRVSLAQCSRAYSVFQELCNHSFQSYSGNGQNQSRFLKLNLQAFIDAARGGGDGTFFFQNKDVLNYGCPIANYYMGEGTINSFLTVTPRTIPATEISVEKDLSGVPGLQMPYSSDYSQLTYKAFCDLVSLQVGDQLTFYSPIISTFAGVKGYYIDNIVLGRIVLSPGVGNADDTNIFNIVNVSNHVTILSINDANERNENIDNLVGVPASDQVVTLRNPLYFSPLFKSENIEFSSAEDVSKIPNMLSVNCGFGVIISRKDENGVWKRSNSRLYITQKAILKLQTYANVVDSFKKSTVSVSSSKYLNNATD